MAETGRRAAELYEEGLAAFRAGDSERSRKLNEESLGLARSTDDVPGIVAALIGLARVALRDGDVDGVHRLTREARAVAAGSPERRLLVLPLHLDAEARRMAGDLDVARRLYEESIALNTELGDERMLAVERSNLAWVYINTEDPSRASELLGEALRYADAHDDEYGRAFALVGFGRIAVDRGAPALAATLLGAVERTLARDGVVLDPADQPELDRAVELARAQLDEGEFEDRRAEGLRMPAHEAIALATGGSR